MLCLSGFELYSRWVPLIQRITVTLKGQLSNLRSHLSNLRSQQPSLK